MRFKADEIVSVLTDEIRRGRDQLAGTREVGRVLEVGSGPGWVTEMLMGLGFEVDAVEPSASMIRAPVAPPTSPVAITGCPRRFSARAMLTPFPPGIVV